MDSNTVKYWLDVCADVMADGRRILKGADIVRFCDEVAQAHEEELAELESKLAIALGTLKLAKEALHDESLREAAEYHIDCDLKAAPQETKPVITELAPLRGREAVMAEAIQDYLNAVDGKDAHERAVETDWVEIDMPMRLALQSAPKVVFSGTGGAEPSTDMTDVVGATDNPMTWIEGKGWRLTIAERLELDRYAPLPIAVTVIVLANQEESND